MQDITTNMLTFKEAMRHAWNTYFAGGEAPMSPDVQEAFAQVEKGLFAATVLLPLGVPDRVSEYRAGPLSWIVVSPVEGLPEMPVQVGARDGRGNMKWAPSIKVPVDDRLGFEFFDFFDWYPYGRIDLSYVRVRIRQLPSHPDAQGSMALIEQRHCRFSFTG
jgi:hypothetical protein